VQCKGIGGGREGRREEMRNGKQLLHLQPYDMIRALSVPANARTLSWMKFNIFYIKKSLKQWSIGSYFRKQYTKIEV
jgi:hypothetical protein